MSSLAEGRDASPGLVAGVAGVAAVILLATLGEGGGAPTGLLVWHGALAALICLGLVRTAGESSVVALPPAFLAGFSLFCILTLAGALRAPYAYAAWLFVLELAAGVGVAWLAARIGPGLAGMLAWPLAVAGAAHGVGALIERAAGDARPASTFLNPNHLAAWLVASLLLVVGAFVARPSADRRWLLGLCVPMAAAVAVSGSRGALLGLAVGGAWLGLVSRGRIGPRLRRVAAGGLVLVALLVVWGQAVRLRDYDPFRYYRTRIWSASLGELARSPWWGTGPGQFAEAAAGFQFPDDDGPLRFDRQFSTSHSDLLRVPVELGLPAALAALVALAAGAAHVARARRRGSLPSTADGAIAALVAVGTQGLVDNPSTWSSVYVLAAALAGSLIGAPRAAAVERSLLARLVAVAVVGIVFLVGDVAPWLAWREGTMVPAGSAGPEEVARLRSAVRLNPLHPLYRTRLAEQIAAGPTWDLAAYAAAREHAEHAVRLQPAAAEYHRRLARLESFACRGLFPDEACRSRAAAHYLRAEQRAPTRPAIPLELAAFLLDTGDPAGARAAAERALALEPEAVLPRLLLADALIEAHDPGDAGGAAALLEEARERARGSGRAPATPYERQMLGLDPGAWSRLQRKLAAVASREEAGEAGSR